MRTWTLLLGLALVLGSAATLEAEDSVDLALRQAKARAMRPVPKVPARPKPKEVWVSERRAWVPGLGVFAIVPGHWERRISATRTRVPPLTIYRESDRAPLTVFGGEARPAERRPAP